jgi:hypothetical protein
VSNLYRDTAVRRMGGRERRRKIDASSTTCRRAQFWFRAEGAYAAKRSEIRMLQQLETPQVQFVTVRERASRGVD